MDSEKNSRIADIGLAPLGEQAISWARAHSPLVDGYLRDRLSDGSLEGRKVAVVVHLEAKTALLATVLADAGADVVVAGSNPHSTRDEIAAALVARGIEVHSSRNSGYSIWESDLDVVASRKPELIIDDGAELTLRIVNAGADHGISGVTEQTTTGVARLRQLQALGRVSFPVLAANDAKCKHLFDNRYGTGQSTVQAILNLTNMLMAGKNVAIFGYGWVGRGIATHVRALGGTAWIIEVDSVKALEAVMDGHQVAAAADALPTADFVLTATGGIKAVGAKHFEMMKEGAILANAGHHDLEIDVDWLKNESEMISEVREGIDRYEMRGIGHLYVLANGALVNIAGGLGHPIEIMDLSFAVQGVGCHELAKGNLVPGVTVIASNLDNEIAAAALAAQGVMLDEVSAEQTENIELMFGKID
ncbi:MAG TPA: adenosylhomocysteinase [Acidimicrobiaceae bacterium]|jgi:adenosylhomocysteinase|nr:adenosylhomocysteinase [Actinomycetota bacterium]HAN07800.1 adenosylhomocysteinase [Acidimicrobiaceae bacterium]